MKMDIKKYLYIFIAICVIFFIGKILTYLLPIIIILGLVTYVAIKVKGFIKTRKNQKEINNYNKHENEYNYETQTDDYTTGEIIDVDYEEVDNKK